MTWMADFVVSIKITYLNQVEEQVTANSRDLISTFCIDENLSQREIYTDVFRSIIEQAWVYAGKPHQIEGVSVEIVMQDEATRGE